MDAVRGGVRARRRYSRGSWLSRSRSMRRDGREIRGDARSLRRGSGRRSILRCRRGRLSGERFLRWLGLRGCRLAALQPRLHLADHFHARLHCGVAVEGAAPRLGNRKVVVLIEVADEIELVFQAVALHRLQADLANDVLACDRIFLDDVFHLDPHRRHEVARIAEHRLDHAVLHGVNRPPRRVIVECFLLADLVLQFK